MTKKALCKDQREGLIAKLTAFFKGLGAEVIDDVGPKPKNRLTLKRLKTARTDWPSCLTARWKP